jgi:hypothetical protein
VLLVKILRLEQCDNVRLKHGAQARVLVVDFLNLIKVRVHEVDGGERAGIKACLELDEGGLVQVQERGRCRVRACARAGHDQCGVGRGWEPGRAGGVGRGYSQDGEGKLAAGCAFSAWTLQGPRIPPPTCPACALACEPWPRTLCLDPPCKRANPLLVVGHAHLPAVHISEGLVAPRLEVRNELEGLIVGLTQLVRLRAERVLEVSRCA